MKGLGTDEKAIIDVLTSCNNAQRQEIKAQYEVMFEKELVKHLKSEISGKFEDVILLLLDPIPDHYAGLINKAVKGIGTKESLLMEVLVSLNVAQLQAVKDSYKKLYEKDMLADIQNDTSGDFEKFLTGLLAGNRNESMRADSYQAEVDAKSLYDAGVGKFFGTKESDFFRIFSTRSYVQLREIFKAYEKIAKETIEESIKKEFSGDAEYGLVEFVSAVSDLPGYFAAKLHKSMKGAGTKDKVLIRILICRSEFDLQDIKHRYQELYGKHLSEAIKADTSGDYERVLLRIIGE